VDEEKKETAASTEPEEKKDASLESQGVKKAEFSSLTDEAKGAKPMDINFLMDISLQLSIELGRAVLNVKDILSLRDGSVVELNKLAGDPVDIFVNNKLIARGEVVVIDDNFGVRVTDILSPTELLNNLKNGNQQ
jgi:flagellar motor switch protein FliN